MIFIGWEKKTYRVSHIHTSEKAAIHVFDKKSKFRSETKKSFAINALVDHPFVIKTLETFETSTHR